MRNGTANFLFLIAGKLNQVDTLAICECAGPSSKACYTRLFRLLDLQTFVHGWKYSILKARSCTSTWSISHTRHKRDGLASGQSVWSLPMDYQILGALRVWSNTLLTYLPRWSIYLSSSSNPGVYELHNNENAHFCTIARSRTRCSSWQS